MGQMGKNRENREKTQKYLAKILSSYCLVLGIFESIYLVFLIQQGKNNKEKTSTQLKIHS